MYCSCPQAVCQSCSKLLLNHVLRSKGQPVSRWLGDDWPTSRVLVTETQWGGITKGQLASKKAAVRGYPQNPSLAEAKLKEVARATASRGKVGVKGVPSQAVGGLPRFFLENLPVSKGVIVKLEGNELWHLAKALRLKPGSRLELFDGQGGLATCQLVRLERAWAELEAEDYPETFAPSGPQWEVAVACGSLKGGRADWLVEKLTELGASALLPLVTKRSPNLGENKLDRWERVALAAAKQSQRLHSLKVHDLQDFAAATSLVKKAPVALLATAGGAPLASVIDAERAKEGGLLLIGPEGDFSPAEVSQLQEAGAIPVGLGPRRLRVETAAIAALTFLMMLGENPAETEVVL